MPATWNTRSTPRIARRTARRSQTSRGHGASAPGRPARSRSDSGADRRRRTSSPRCDQQPGDVRADEPGRSGDERVATWRSAARVRRGPILSVGCARSWPRRDRLRHLPLPAAPSWSPSTASTQVSLYVHWRGRDRSARARSPTTTPTTGGSAPAEDAADHLAAVDRRLPRRSTSRCSSGGDDIVSIHLAGGMSGHGARRPSRPASSSATGAERVHVIDSATACGGEGLVVLAAAAAAARRAPTRAAVAERARRARDGLKMWFAIDTLEYLRRGGRIAGAQAWLGSALKIKPILTVESEITPVERVRTSRRAFERMVDLLAVARTRTAPTRGWSSTSRRPSEAAGAGRARHRDLRVRAAGDLGDRPGDRHPRRPRAARAPAGSRARSSSAHRADADSTKLRTAMQIAPIAARAGPPRGASILALVGIGHDRFVDRP